MVPMTRTPHDITASRALRSQWVAAELGLAFETLPMPYRAE